MEVSSVSSSSLYVVFSPSNEGHDGGVSYITASSLSTCCCCCSSSGSSLTPSLNVETVDYPCIGKGGSDRTCDDDDDVNDNTDDKAIPSSMILMLAVFVEGTGSSS